MRADRDATLDAERYVLRMVAGSPP